MMRGEPFHFQTRIRFIDTDASGRIHYTAMFRYFESAETEFMRMLGVHYLKHDFTLPRVHVECDFRLAIEHDDVIDIELRVVKIGRSSIHFGFQALKGGEPAASGAIVVACMDRKTQRAAPLPEVLRAKLAEVCGE
ncbi:MAG TPA: thioesterase family protein [Bryobacteraceae bacterium]|jgi:YbgC/YbaW family acyl-CoA thioester hydrolase